MKLNFTLFLLFFISIYNLNAQQSINCGTDVHTQKLYKQFPERLKKANEIDKSIYEQLKNVTAHNYKNGTRGPVRVVPVVVHIIHNNGPENITNIQVLQGIQDLNDAFRNQNGLNVANGVDTEIEFCMAQRDPNGNATNGITRTVSTLTNMVMENDDAALKALIVWNPNLYLNIWLVKDINSIANGPGVSGYATLPSSHGLSDDGIVNEAYYFGSTPNNSKVHIHEAGHYLNLLHTFEGGCVNNNCLNNGDKVCDTPPDNSTANVTCGSPINTCTTDPNDLSINNPFRPVANGGIGDQPDMIENHMDYGDVLCHTRFTQGQKDRMQAAVTGPRASLLQSIACTSPCPTPINIGINPSATTITVGGNVNFTNSTTGATGYVWSIGGSTFSTATNSSNTFNQTGNFWVVLTATNSDTNCRKQDSVLITVNCSATASFTTSATNINPGGSITFTSTSTGATSYQWYIDGVPQVTTPNFTNTFNNVGGYNVYLVVCNALCCDTSLYQFVTVGTCTSKEANNWYFGYNSVWNFNTGTPVPSNVSAMRAEEAAATISDKNGNILMYCDGERLYNKNHVLMANGQYLWGHKSSTMGALIVQQPGSASNYYVFTADAQCGGTNTSYAPYTLTTFPRGAITYNVVDITANGGLGAVILKNQLLYAGSTEKLVGIKHTNGTDIWIVTHDTLDNFYSHLLTCTGLNPTPVISKTGFSHQTTTDWNNTNSLGMMMISPNGKKIAVNCRISGTQLGDFNTSTGVVSNMATIDPPQLQIAQGLAFSPDSKKLYSTAIAPGFNGMYQYDVSLGTPAAITGSVFQMVTNNNSVYAGMQLGPDGKIYLAELNGTNLHVINNPNAAGAACNLAMSSVPLAGGATSRFALPNFLVDFMSPKKAAAIQGPPIMCVNTTYYINNNCGLSNDSLVWTLSGNASIVSNIDSAITLATGANGTATLISFQYSSCGVVSDTLVIQVGLGTPVTLGNDTTICGTISMTLDAGAGYTSYLWSTTDTTQTINITNAGTYWVQVNVGGCIFTDTIIVTLGTTMPSVNLGSDKIVCPGQVVTFDAGAGYQTYTWQDNSHNQTFTAWSAGTYWVTVKDFCGNISRDTIKVLPDLSGSFVLNDTVICNNQPITLNSGTGFVSYLWSTTDTTQTISASTSGTYWAQVTDSSGCSYSDTLTVAIGLGPTVSLGNDTTVCNFTSLTLNAGGNYSSYLWNTSDTTASISVTITGTYWVQVTDSIGCTKNDTLNVFPGGSQPSVALGNDTIICGTISMILNAGGGYNNYLWSTTDTTQSINITAAGTYWVSVKDTCGFTTTDTMIVTLGSTLPNVSLGSNAILCPGNTSVLDAGAGYQSYLWQNNSTNQTFTVTAPGTYFVTATDSCGNISTDSVVFQADNASPVNLGQDKLICDDSIITIDAGSNYQSYLWQNNSTNQTFVASAAGTYNVQVTSANGCIYRDTIVITTHDCDTIPPVCDLSNVPNAFSPNGDGKNDEFCLYGWEACMEVFNVIIYNRWGERMFESKDPAFCWDGMYKGKILDAQVFVYTITGISKNKEVILKNGNISLIK